MFSESYIEILEALPDPAWELDCFLLQTVRENTAARTLSAGGLLAIFEQELDEQLVARLRSIERQVNFQARIKHNGTVWTFCASRLGAVTPQATARRLVVAQPAARLDVPVEITFDELLDSSFEGLMILNARRRIAKVSRCFREMFGYKDEELEGHTPAMLVPDDRQHEFAESLVKLDRGGIHRLETKRRHRNGSLIDVLISSQPIHGGIYRGGMVVIYRDVTELNRNARHRNLRVESNRILSEASSLGAAATELLPLVCAALDWDVARLWGSTGSNLECRHSFARPNCDCPSIASPESRCALNIQTASQGHSIEVQNFQPTGGCASNPECKLREGSQLAVPILDAQRNILGVLETATVRRSNHEEGRRELLEGICAHLGQFMTRTRAERALAENEARFRTLAETAPVAIFIHNDGKIVYANAAFEALSGYGREEYEQISLWKMFVPEEVDLLRDRARRRVQGEDMGKRWSSRILRKNGEVRWIDYSASRLLLGSGPVVLAAATDATEQRAMETQLRQTQKMDAIGRLAGGVAHDFNNLLTVIGCCSESILSSVHLDSEVRRFTLEIGHASDRAAALTRQLLSFSRHQLVAPRRVDLSEVLQSMELILRRSIGEDIALHTKFEPGYIILAEPSQIEQVMLNLAVNARDAMPGGGSLTVQVRKATAGEQEGRSATPFGYTVLSVADSGCGMGQEVQQHIFEPFFTTKHAASGTGLGLSTVYGIVKQSGGFIRVRSEEGKGTVMDVFFPVAAPAGEIAPAEPSAVAVPGRNATILLAEDENDLRSVLVMALRRAGHQVLANASGAEALRASEEYKDKIDLLITDVVMAGMSGRELVDHLMETRPETKVLFISGYNEDTVLQKGVVEGQVEFLQKPFTLQKLAQRVSQILHGQKANG